MFERMADKYEGEAMAAIARPNPRREEYVCTSCNMDLVVDLYNRLHTRDEVVFCPSCKRMLYIPEDLTPENAVKQKKAPRARKGAADEETASVEESGQA
jgi:DNA-directed RNA polymerase subunit RPC12/RpoP